jgi:putative restriction endonuclease
MLVTDSYQRRCAVTGEKALPVLDAAYILPGGKGGQHRLDNSLLLRTNVHRLYDKGYVTVTPDGHFLVSRRFKDDFDNGEPYMPFHGQRIWMPGDPVSQPNREPLEWHAEGVFLGWGAICLSQSTLEPHGGSPGKDDRSQVRLSDIAKFFDQLAPCSG